MRIPFIAGNWKMYKTVKEARLFAQEFKKLYHDTDVKTAIFAPFTQLQALKEELEGSGIGVGAQNPYIMKRKELLPVRFLLLCFRNWVLITA